LNILYIEDESNVAHLVQRYVASTIGEAEIALASLLEKYES